MTEASEFSQSAALCLVLYEEELGGQNRVFRRIQVTGSAFVSHHKESHIADNVQLL